MERKKSVLYQHCIEHHGGVLGPNNGLTDFVMTTDSTASPPLLRILEEGIVVKEIEADPDIECLNGRDEYYRAEFIKTTYNVGAGADLSSLNTRQIGIRNNGR